MTPARYAPLAALLVLLAVPNVLPAQEDAHRMAVRQAVLDYVEGVYEVAPARIERSVSPDLVKRGYWREDANAAYRMAPMTYQQLVDLAARWNKNGHVDAKSAPKEVVVFDVLDKIATAKLVAEWGVDYFHLAKVDGTWKIMNVLWQSPPATM